MSDKIYGVKENKALVEVSPKSDVDNLKNDISKKVSKAGDTMTGDLAIKKSSEPSIYELRTDVDITDTVGSAIRTYSLCFRDKNNVNLAWLRSRILANGTVTTDMLARNRMSGTNYEGLLGVTVDNNNSIYAFAPTPSAKNDNSTKIATTAWVNTASTVVHTTGNETVSGTKTFTNLNVNGTLSVNGMPVSSGIAELYNMAPQLRYGDNVFAVLVNDYPDAFFGKTLIFKLAFGSGGTYKTSVNFVQCHTIDEFGDSSSMNPKYTFEPISDNYLAIYCKRESRADTAGQTHDALVFNLMVGSTSAMLNDMTFSVYVKD